ncbi:MAG TPA: hypothetical protein VHZ54_07850 [Solirubrobacterales bacterium]|nr:hypothetical protein [Solirubrobacterales bacterium]
MALSKAIKVAEVEVPASAPALSTLPRVDYRDGFRLEFPGGPRLSGEEWAREMLEGASPETRRSLRRGWPLLGLKMAPPGATGAILGWRLRHSGSDYALLGADSRIGMPAELLLLPEPGGLFFATLIQQRNPLAHALWAPIGRPHRRVVPALMRHAAARVSARADSGAADPTPTRAG